MSQTKCIWARISPGGHQCAASDMRSKTQTLESDIEPALPVAEMWGKALNHSEPQSPFFINWGEFYSHHRDGMRLKQIAHGKDHARCLLAGPAQNDGFVSSPC